ncbi:Ig-like domain (group 2) [Anaerocolumna jejuensis DSM 15929]|uniref:Ig-like domain (Group 2) n=1 Tax=Anaerocolumna jejuensis DSM 15929 TaxID=1121322 RepID=A0A1M6JH57_9FIRM|nr:Ig-like domain-containing protein [Anaerocolumna jejuensis]SHJ46010.1 Ig-like domain (group 2) [Anaerocolumna jejuensis DSM 15929]
MNQLKKFGKMLSIVLMLSMVMQLALPIHLTTVANAATVAVNPKKVTLEVGKTKILKVTGTKVKAIWKSSNVKVATVSKTGLVTAKQAGKATITATVKTKKYICIVTVKDVKKNNPLVNAAPFKAQAVTSGAISYIVPSNWNKTETEANGYKQIVLIPKTAEAAGKSSNIALILSNLKSPIDSATLESLYKEVTTDALVSQFAQAGMEVTISNLTVNSYKTELGLGYVTQYDLNYSGTAMKQVIYGIYTNKHFIQITVTDINDNLSPDVKQVADYLLKTIQVSE